MCRVLVIGGNPHSNKAAVMTAIGAKTAGATMIHLYTPPEHIESAKEYSTNFILHGFVGHTGSLGLYDVKIINEISQNIDVISIGNGLGKDFDAKKALLAIININKPIVIDSDALIPEIFKLYDRTKHRWILIPNSKEFEELFKIESSRENILIISKKYHVNLYVKEDFLPEATITGVICSYIAQGFTLSDAITTLSTQYKTQ